MVTSVVVGAAPAGMRIPACLVPVITRVVGDPGVMITAAPSGPSAPSGMTGTPEPPTYWESAALNSASLACVAADVPPMSLPAEKSLSPKYTRSVALA